MLKGTVHKYGDSINTDLILPGAYVAQSKPEELARHCLEGLDPEFVAKVKTGDILLCGENFGCGSSREHAPIALLGSGLSCVVAKSFARIFFRNAMNIGLPLFESPAAVDGSDAGDILQVDAGNNTILNLRTGKSYPTLGASPLAKKILAAGGLLASIKKEMENEHTN